MKTIFLVDADDTILNFHGASAIALRAGFEGLNIPWKEEYLVRFKEINAGLWEALERKELTRAKLMETRFHVFLEALGLSDYNGDAFNEIFLKHLATHPLYIDGAQAFLRGLRALGRVYIVTNGTAWIQKSRFDIAGLWDYAEDVFVSDLIGYDKPAKEYTEYVISHIPRFKADDAVWIGDSLSADIKGANEAKITSVWFNPNGKIGNGIATPDYTAKSFEEILEWIKDGN